MKIGIMENIGRQDQHNSGSGHPNQKGKIRDIKTPADNVIHTGDRETISCLNGIGIDSNSHANQENQPEKLKTESTSEIPANDISDESSEVFMRGCTHFCSFSDLRWLSFYDAINQ
jgi:hypothetical protein